MLKILPREIVEDGKNKNKYSKANRPFERKGENGIWNSINYSAWIVAGTAFCCCNWSRKYQVTYSRSQQEKK